VFEREEIMVTGSRIMADMPMPAPMMEMAAPPPPPPMMMAQQEDLGDLKLYRIPEPVTVAARSQKQVALLAREGVKVETIYRAEAYDRQALAVTRVLTARNTREGGLGLPLPAGRLVLFGTGRARPMLLGRGFVDDRAVGEKVEIPVGAGSSVTARLVRLPAGAGQEAEWELNVGNAQPAPIRFEAYLMAGAIGLGSPAEVGSRDGRPLWAVTVPANGSATLRYRIAKP
jgi:hypothetical protein